MNECRLNSVDKDGHVEGPPDGFVCESDEAAIEWAKHLIDGHDVELWQLDCLVIRLKSKTQ
jgi:hypothetical protein